MPQWITSPANHVVKLIRSLGHQKGRTETGLFLVEGIHPAGEVIEAGWDLHSLVYAPELLTSDYARQLVSRQQARGMVSCIALASELFISLAGKDNPQGILAVVHQQHLNLKDISQMKISSAAALVSPQDPGNVGTILRTLDAVGADGLFLLDGGVELYHPTLVRASMGTLFWKAVVRVSFDEFAAWRLKESFTLIGSSAHGGMDYRQCRWEQKRIILLLGNEQRGLSAEQLSTCDQVVSMPMKGRSSSLNLAVAAGILLFRMMENK